VKTRLSTHVACVAFLATASCEQILSLHERSEAIDGPVGPDASAASQTDASGTATGTCGPLIHPSASCAACMDQACCAEATTCAGDRACQEASDCLAGCSDSACRAQCAQFYSLPDTLIALRSCRIDRCASACGSACGEIASPIFSCQSCEEASCCAESAACAANTACAQLNRCVSNCFGTASCPSDCQAEYPQGVADFQALFSCNNQCASACPAGQSWACLNSPIVWPKPNVLGNVTFSITFVSFTSEQPFEGANVKACSKLDFSCSTPLATTTSDATGLVTVTVPVGLSGFDGYLDVTGGKVGGTGAAVFPAIWYPVPYVIADGWRGRTQLPSTDEFGELTMASGTQLTATRGHIAVNAGDCAFTPAAGVSFTATPIDQATVPYYLVGGVPATTATATDSSGVAAFVNLPTMSTAGLAVVSATAGQAQGKSMGSLTFIVRPGTLTTSGLFPPVP
jgi:hypothetical protein